MAVISETPPLGRAEARQLTGRIKEALDVSYELIILAYQGRAWEAMGHASWDGYCQVEFKGARMLRLAVDQRQEIVSELKEAGMSTRQIGSALGVGQRTIVRDGRGGESFDSPSAPAPDAEAREERRTRVMELHEQGMSGRKIATELGVDDKTVRGDIRLMRERDPIVFDENSCGPVDIYPRAYEEIRTWLNPLLESRGVEENADKRAKVRRMLERAIRKIDAMDKEN